MKWWTGPQELYMTNNWPVKQDSSPLVYLLQSHWVTGILSGDIFTSIYLWVMGAAFVRQVNHPNIFQLRCHQMCKNHRHICCRFCTGSFHIDTATAMWQQVKGGEVSSSASGNYYHSSEFTGTLCIKWVHKLPTSSRPRTADDNRTMRKGWG